MNELLLKAPTVTEAYDTSVPAFQSFVEEVVNWYGGQSRSCAEIDQEVREQPEGAGVFEFRIALKIAESRRILGSLRQPITISLINPVYKETGRIQPRDEHPHGENSIRCKANLLNSLEASNSMLTCRLIVVDDECPEGSGRMAEEILKNEYRAAFGAGKFQVLFLREAIDGGDPDVPPGLTHKDGANRSVKGGAVLFAMRKTIQQEVSGLHIVVDNDADLSVHPAQLGLLVEAIVAGEAEAVAGSRREKDSVALIGGSRDTRGQLFIKVWRHFLPELAEKIIDTNRAFKAFSAQALQQILAKIEIYTFPYQIELLQACVSCGIPLQKRGIAYVDSEAASTQQGETITESYLNQVHQIIDIAKRYQTIDPADPTLKFLEGISEERWLQIEADPPADLFGD